jgi:hypothetical protein
MIAPAAVRCKRRLGNGQFDARAEVNGSRVFNARRVKACAIVAVEEACRVSGRSPRNPWLTGLLQRSLGRDSVMLNELIHVVVQIPTHVRIEMIVFHIRILH